MASFGNSPCNVDIGVNPSRRWVLNQRCPIEFS